MVQHRSKDQPQLSNYQRLFIDFAPRPITSETELNKTQKVIDSLLDQEEITKDEEDYLHVLSNLVLEYEQKKVKLPELRGIDLLKALIHETGLRQKDLVDIFKTESIISEILKGHRRLTVEHIQKLAERFKLPPQVFFTE